MRQNRQTGSIQTGPELPELDAGGHAVTQSLASLAPSMRTLDRLYREAETYVDEVEDLLVRTLATVACVADRHDIPALVTRSQVDSFSEPLAAAAQEAISCEQTKFGPRFVSENFETLVYPLGDGRVQTAFAFRKRVLQARASVSETTETPQGVTVNGAC